MVVVVAVSVVAPLLLLVVVLIKCLGCLRKKEGFKTFENEDARMEARINPGFAMGQDVDDREQTMSTTIQIEPLPELLAESTPRKPKIACVEKTKQEAAFKLVVINNPHPFPRRQLTYLKEIGNGWFGQVLESDAEHITTGIPLSRVVAKVLRDDASNSEKKLFLEDVVPYRELEHSNVLRLLGQCTESAPYLMILEYAQMGDLKTCVKKLKDRADVMTQNYQVVKFAIDAASGLACLHRHGYIHQDFAARNCVVMADYTVKIGDYGISEDVFKDDYYISGKESLPIRWMAPETLSQQSGSWQTAVITREANIWSFGVLLWEVLMFGKQPYGNMSDDQVLQTVIADRMVKLPEPDINIQFKDRIVEVMLFCWLNPSERPSIEDAHGLLQRLYEIVVGDQAKAENFEKKWNQMIPHEARVVSATLQTKQQKRPTSASFDNNFVQEPKPEPQQALTEQSVKPGDLVSVKIEDMSTSVVNGDHVAVNMQPSLAGNLAQLPTPSRHTLPAHMTSTPIMDLEPTPTEPNVSQKQKSGSGSRTSRKIEDEFSIAQAVSNKSNSGSVASPVPSEEKTPDVLIDVPEEDTDADHEAALHREEIVPVSDQFDLLGGNTAVSATQPSSSVDVLETVGEPVQDVQKEHNTQEANKQEQTSVNIKDPFADLFGQGDIADQIKPVSSQPNSTSEELPIIGNQSLLSDSSPKSDAESPVSGFDEPDTKAEPVGKQTASSDTTADTDVEPQNFLSNDVDLVSSHNFQALSIIPSTFHPSERSAGEPVSKGENVKPSDLALDNGTSGYETPADQSVKSDSNEENTSGAESSSDSAVCVSSPELADAPSSFDGAAPSHEKVGTCVEYVSDDESKSSSSESDSSSDSSNSGSSYVCEESRRIIQVTDLDADDDDSDNLDEHQDNISDEVTDSDEDLDLRLASELYLSKGVSSPRVFERPPLETIPEDVMPSPSDTSSIDLKFDAHFDDVFASQDNFEWDDFMGESIVGRDRTSNTPKASFDMSDWLMDGDSLSYRSSGSIQSPLESVSPDILGTTDPSIRLSTASTSEVKRHRGRTSRSYVSDLITNRSIHDSFTNTKNTRTPFYSLFDNVDMDSDSDSNLSPESNQPESRLIETAPAGLHDKVEDLASGSRTDDSLFIQQPSLGPTDATFSVETTLSSAPMLEADVTSQKLPNEQQTEESPDPSENFKGLGGIDKGKGNVNEQGQPKKKPVPKDLESAFEELASQHGIDLFGAGEVSNTSDNQFNEFSFESLGKSDDLNLFDDFISPDTNDMSDKSEVPSVAAFFTGSDIPEIPVASKAVDAAPVKPLEDDSFSRETVISQTAASIDFVTPEVDSSSVIHKSDPDPNENEKNEFIDINRAPNKNDESDSVRAESYALTQSDITGKSSADERDKTEQFTDPETITVSLSDLDATDSFKVDSFPEGQSVNVSHIPSTSELEIPPVAVSTIDIAGRPEVISNNFSQENMTDSLTQLGDSLVNIDVLSIHIDTSDMLQGSYEVPPDCQVVGVSTSGSSVVLESVVSPKDAEITSTQICGSESEVGKIPYSDMLHEDLQTSPDLGKPHADQPGVTGLESTALVNENRGVDSALANVEAESEVSVKQEDSDINFEESFSFTFEPHYSQQGTENYESGDNTSFDMVGSASDVEIITESPTYSMDELNEYESANVCELVPSDSPPNMSLSVEIGQPSMDAVQDSMAYAGPTTTPDLLPADTDSNRDEVATGNLEADDNAGISGESLVVMDTDKDVDTFSALEEQTLSTEPSSPKEVLGTNFRPSESGTDKADEVSGPGPIPDTVSKDESEDAATKIGLQSMMAIEQTKDMDEDHDVSAQELHSSDSQMHDDVQEIVNQPDAFEGTVTNQSAAVEEGSDPDVSDDLISNKESDDLDFFSSGSLCAQDNDVSVKPDFQTDIINDSLLPVHLSNEDENPTTSFSNILTQDAVGETEKEIHTFETNAPIQHIFPEPHQVPPCKNSGFEQIPLPSDLSFVSNSHQLIDEDKTVVETPQPQDQLIGVNISQQIPSDEDDGFTDLGGFNRIPVPDDLPSVSDFEPLTDSKSQSAISIESKQDTTEVIGSSGITSNVINDFGQQFISGIHTLEERTAEPNNAADFTSHVSEHDAPEENAEKEDETGAELKGLIMAGSVKTDDAVVESESVNFVENVIHVNAPGLSCCLDAEADHHDVDVPSQSIKPAPAEAKSESPELKSSQFEVHTVHSDQVSSSEQGSWDSNASEAGSDQSINDFEDLGIITPEHGEVRQTGDGSTMSTDSLLDGFVEISSSPVEVGISESSEAEANSDSKFPENFGQDGETVDETGDGFLVLSGSEDKQTKVDNDGSNESNVGQGIIDFPDSSLTDSQESAAFLDLSSSQEGLVVDSNEFGISETSALNRASTVTEIVTDTGQEQVADSGVLSTSLPITSSQTEEIIFKPFEDLSSDLNMHSSQDTVRDTDVSKAAHMITPEDDVNLSPTDDNKETSLPFNTNTHINNETVGTNGFILSTDTNSVQSSSGVPSQNQMKGDMESSNKSSVVSIDDSDAVLPVMARQTEDSDPFCLTSRENTVSNFEASDAFTSVEPGPATDTDPFGLPLSETTIPKLEALDGDASGTEQMADTDPFGLTSHESSVPKLETFTSEQTAESDPFVLSPLGENTDSKLLASDPSEPEPATDTDPFGLTSHESSVPKLETFTSEQTAESDPFVLSPLGENTDSKLLASDPSEPEPATDTDPFGLTSHESSVPKLETFTSEQTAESDPFVLSPLGENTDSKLLASDPSEPEPATDTDPFGLTSSENNVPKLEASDAIPSVETDQTAETDPFGVATPSGENSVTDLGASDSFLSMEPLPTTDTDPLGLTSTENTIPRLEASEAFSCIETEETADNDPFGLATSAESTDSSIFALDPFSSEEPGPISDKDPFGLAISSGEITKTTQEVSDAIPSVEPGPASATDPFDLTSSENTVPRLEASGAFSSIETGQTAESDPFGQTSPSGENMDSNLASDPFPSVEPVPTIDTEPFGLTSATVENIVPNLNASDALPSIETDQTVDSNPFGLEAPSGENTDSSILASDSLASEEPGATSNSDPFGLAAPPGEDTKTHLEVSDAFPSVEPGPTSGNNPFGLTSSVNTIPRLEASDAFSSIETEETVDYDPFGLAIPSAESTDSSILASDPFSSEKPGPTSDKDPFGLAAPSGENTKTTQEVSDALPSVEPGPASATDLFDLTSSENTVPRLEASGALSSTETEQTAERDPFGLATPSGENTDSKYVASDLFPSVETGLSTNTDPFDLTSSENNVPKLEASDAFASVETDQTVDSDPFGLTTSSGENTVTDLSASITFSSVGPGPATDSDPFGVATPSGGNTDSSILPSDPFSSEEPGATSNSDPFGLAAPSSEDTKTHLEVSDAFPTVEPGSTSGNNPFGLKPSENTVPELEASDAFSSVETEETVDSDPFGLAPPSGENTDAKLVASDPFPSVESGLSTDSDPFDLTSSENNVPKLEASDALTSVKTDLTVDSDPFGLATPSGENMDSNLVASDAFPSVEPGPITDTKSFGLTSATVENIVPSLNVSDALPSLETEQRVDSNPFGLEAPSGENTDSSILASDAFTLEEPGATSNSDPFGLAAPPGEDTKTHLEVSDAFPSVEPGPTSDDNSFGQATPGESTNSNIVASDIFPSVEPIPNSDSDPFGLTSSENTVPKLEASDAIPSVETEQIANSDPFGLATPPFENMSTNLDVPDPISAMEPGPTSDTDPFDLTSRESTVQMQEVSDAFASTESDPFGLPSSTDENILTNPGVQDAFTSTGTGKTANSDLLEISISASSLDDTVPSSSEQLFSAGTGQVTDSDPFGMTDPSENDTVPNLSIANAFSNLETPQTVDSDPFGLTSASGENTLTNNVASDPFSSGETEQRADSDPFGMTSPPGENTDSNIIASDPFSSGETEQKADCDPFGLASASGENTLTNNVASDPFSSGETEQRADSDPFGLASASGENTLTNNVASDPFSSGETEQRVDSDPFGMTSPPGENTDSNNVASDPFSSGETEQRVDSDPFGMTSPPGENTDSNIIASDPFSSGETEQRADSDPFGMTSPPGENTDSNIIASDPFSSGETEQKADSDPFASGENTLTNNVASDPFYSGETEQRVDSDPFGLTSSENTLTNNVASDPFSSGETEQRVDSDPFGLTSSENTETNLSASNVFPPLETAQMTDSDPFGLMSQVEPRKLETGDMFDASASSNIESVTTHQNPMTDSGMLFDFVQSVSEASRTDSDAAAEMFTSSPDFTPPSSQDLSQSAANTKESDQSVLLDMFEKPPNTQNIEPQSSDSSSLVDLF